MPKYYQIQLMVLAALRAIKKTQGKLTRSKMTLLRERHLTWYGVVVPHLGVRFVRNDVSDDKNYMEDRSKHDK